MGSSAWKPGRRPWKVDCIDSFTASDVAVVAVSLIGHVDGWSGRWEMLVLAALRIWQLPDYVSEA
jgi:hypothetical protein